VIQSDRSPEELWRSLPAAARRALRERSIRVYALDAFSIASQEATDAELRYRMQGAAFLGAFFAVSPLAGRAGLDESALFAGIHEQLEHKVRPARRAGGRGQPAGDPARLRRARSGDPAGDEIEEGGTLGQPAVGALPALLDSPGAAPGPGHPGRFWEQVCGLCKLGRDPIADPFAALSAIPAATGVVRDMTGVRFEVPDFIADRCTGCSQCWVQCPDAAIPGLVSTVEQVLDGALKTAANGRSLDRLRQVKSNLAREVRKVLAGVPFTTFGDTLAAAYQSLVDRLGWEPEKRHALDQDFAALFAVLADFPLARTVPFFDVPERREKGSGGLLSITVNPDACKGCNICVEVCPEHALVTVKQDAGIVERLRRNWELWENLGDTDDRFINVSDVEEGRSACSTRLCC
jgi:pyruvate-ferredoxin/flavodoxin oxidoreductase